MKKKRMTICGRKTTTPPAPAMMPSTIRLCSKPSGSHSPTHSPKAPAPASIMSISTSAQAKTAWKTKNRIAARSSGPNTGCSTTRSRRSLGACGAVSASPKRSRIACTRVWSLPASADTPLLRAAQRSGCSSRARRSSAPSLAIATVLTTGIPNSVESASRSMFKPRFSARSAMFSATTQGRPRRCTASARRRLRRRLVASTTQTTRSGRFSSAARP